MRTICIARIFALTLLVAIAPPTLAGEKDVKILNVEKINTERDELDPCPVDSRTFYYVAKNDDGYDIMATRRTVVTQPWPPGKVFPVSTKGADERSPFFFKGTLFFATNEVPDEKFKSLRNFDIVRKPEGLATLPIVSDVSEKTDEMHPWITPAGKEFYFCRKTEKGWVLMVANGPAFGPIAKAKEVGFPVGFHRATLAPSGLDMFLEGPLPTGKIGIFRSKRAKASAEWSEPETVTVLNHPESKTGDMGPALTADGIRLYFVSDRPGGKGGLDIWAVLVSDLKTKK